MSTGYNVSKDWLDLKFRIRDLSIKERETSELPQELINITQNPYELISVLRSRKYNGNQKAEILDKLEKSQASFEEWNSAFVRLFDNYMYEKGLIDSACNKFIFDKIIVKKLNEIAQTPFEKRLVAEHEVCMARIGSDEEKAAANANLLKAIGLCHQDE